MHPCSGSATNAICPTTRCSGLTSSEYNILITHISCTANVADALSYSRHNEPAPPTLVEYAVLEDLPTSLQWLLRSDFVPAISETLPSDPVLCLLAQEAQNKAAQATINSWQLSD